MPIQKTFTLVPEAPGAGKPPPNRTPIRMTSKQVRKAYKAANHTPRLSRAEQLKKDKADQERIRKELDKDRATAKARLAREKKKEKELAQREDKKRKRLPLVDVRPSQDTIARFVRGNGLERKGDGGGQHVDEPRLEEDKGLLDEAKDQPAEEPGPIRRTQFGYTELDLIPEEDDLETELLEQLEAVTPKTAQSHDCPPHMKDTALKAQDGGRVNDWKKRRMVTTHEERVDFGMPPTPIKAQQPDLANPQRTATPSPSPPRAAPPLSTQAILYNLDDFFPSASQQERELDEDFEAPDPSAPEAEVSLPSHLATLPSPTVLPRDEEYDRISSPPPPSRRFFTSSGSHELMSLALHRSRRTASLEKLHQKEKTRPTAVHLARHDKGLAVRRPKPAEPDSNGRPANMTYCSVDTSRSHPAQTPSKQIPEPARRQPINDTRHMNTAPGKKRNTTNTSNAKAENGLVHPTTNKQDPCIDLNRNKENLAPSASQETEYGGDWVDEIALELMI